MPSRPNPNANPKLAAAGRLSNAIQRHGADSPQAVAARVEIKAMRAEEAWRDLIETPPAPSPEVIDRLRRLLPPVAAA